MKTLAVKIANVKIFISWFWSSSKAPIPSESTIRILIFSPSDVVPLIGVPQHHKPLVHGLMVGPTPNPLFLLSKMRLRRYDLPVRYNPATEMTDMGFGILRRKASAVGCISYSTWWIFYFLLRWHRRAEWVFIQNPKSPWPIQKLKINDIFMSVLFIDNHIYFLKMTLF